MFPKKLESTALRSVSLTNTHIRLVAIETEEDVKITSDPCILLIAIEDADMARRDELFESFLPFKPTR